MVKNWRGAKPSPRSEEENDDDRYCIENRIKLYEDKKREKEEEEKRRKEREEQESHRSSGGFPDGYPYMDEFEYIDSQY